MRLFKNEVRRLFSSISYWIVIGCILLFFLMPYLSRTGIHKGIQTEQFRYDGLVGNLHNINNEIAELEADKTADKTPSERTTKHLENLYQGQAGFADWQKAITANDTAGVVAAQLKIYQADLADSKMHYNDRLIDNSNLVNYYQQLKKYHLAEDARSRGAKIPALYRVSSLLENTQKWIYLFVIMSLVIAFFATQTKRKKAIDFVNLMPQPKNGVMLSQYFALLVSSMGLIFIPLLAMIGIISVTDGLGTWHYPLYYLSTGAVASYTIGGQLLNFIGFATAFMAMFTAISYVTQLLTKSLLINMLVLMLIPLTSQLAVLSDSMKEKVTRFLPSVYFYFNNVFMRDKESYYFFKHADVAQRYINDRRLLYFLEPYQGMLVIAAYAVAFLVLGQLLVLKRRKI